MHRVAAAYFVAHIFKAMPGMRNLVKPTTVPGFRKLSEYLKALVSEVWDDVKAGTGYGLIQQGCKRMDVAL